METFSGRFWEIPGNVLKLGLDKKKRALKFALKGSESFKACFDLYRCLNPEKSFKSSFKNDFWAFFHDFCSTMFRVVAWVQVEFRSLSSFRRCMLFDWLLLLLLLSKFTFSRDCVQGWWVPSSKVCFSAMADCISAKSHALNWALKCFKFFIEVCNFFSPFDHIQTSEVCNSPYKPNWKKLQTSRFVILHSNPIEKNYKPRGL